MHFLCNFSCIFSPNIGGIFLHLDGDLSLHLEVFIVGIVAVVSNEILERFPARFWRQFLVAFDKLSP